MMRRSVFTRAHSPVSLTELLQQAINTASEEIRIFYPGCELMPGLFQLLSNLKEANALKVNHIRVVAVEQEDVYDQLIRALSQQLNTVTNNITKITVTPHRTEKQPHVLQKKKHTRGMELNIDLYHQDLELFLRDYNDASFDILFLERPQVSPVSAYMDVLVSQVGLEIIGTARYRKAFAWLGKITRNDTVIIAQNVNPNEVTNTRQLLELGIEMESYECQMPAGEGGFFARVNKFPNAELSIEKMQRTARNIGLSDNILAKSYFIATMLLLFLASNNTSPSHRGAAKLRLWCHIGEMLAYLIQSLLLAYAQPGRYKRALLLNTSLLFSQGLCCWTRRSEENTDALSSFLGLER